MSMNSLSSLQKYFHHPSLMCRSRLIALYWVKTNSFRSPLLIQLDSAKSTIRYPPANGTAGFARSRVNGSSREPLPPASMTAITLFKSPLLYCYRIQWKGFRGIRVVAPEES